MKALSYLASFTIAICGLASIDMPVSATAADITGTWGVTIHYPPPDGDYTATYVLKQEARRSPARTKASPNYKTPTAVLNPRTINMGMGLNF